MRRAQVDASAIRRHKAKDLHASPHGGLRENNATAYAKSKRSKFITLLHAATKSFTNLVLASSEA